MALRTNMNKALTFIGLTTLTDEEFDAADLDEDASDLDQFNALKHVLSERGAQSNSYRRLTSYFKAKGLQFSTSETDEKPPAKSNVYLGSPLE